MSKSLLIIEDDKVLNTLLVQQMQDIGYEVNGVLTWHHAQSHLESHDPDLIILDGRLPDADGHDLVPELVLRCPVVILTAYGSVPQAVSAVRAGASDYLSKPVNPEELDVVIARVLDNETLRQNYQFCRNQLRGKQRKLMVGSSPVLEAVNQFIDAVAPSDMTVLINGESGVGKELVAHDVHDRSHRSENNFVALDCCTIQESLFESELFGHERGAFTGADRKKKGLIDAAEKGTLFLDEIGEIGPAIQAKLLRVLETGRFRRVGGTEDLPSDVRIVAATNRDLEKMVQEGSFRQDLFYRLNAFTIVVPPLRERREDIDALTDHFIQTHNFSRRISKRFNKAAMRHLISYDWPGNVRELRNVVERAIILSREQSEIRLEHLAICVGNRQSGDLGTQLQFDKEPTLDQVERRYLQCLLEKYSGHRGKVAGVMGISERNIYRLIQKYDLGKKPVKTEKKALSN
jgi:DNA-binding NtrC family response regulator